MSYLFKKYKLLFNLIKELYIIFKFDILTEFQHNDKITHYSYSINNYALVFNLIKRLYIFYQIQRLFCCLIATLH